VDVTATAMRYAMWSPLPPERSGISDYSEELLGPLRELVDIGVAAREPDTTEVPADVEVVEPAAASADASQKR
jgi:hypothetical protein